MSEIISLAVLVLSVIYTVFAFTHSVKKDGIIEAYSIALIAATIAVLLGSVVDYLLLPTALSGAVAVLFVAATIRGHDAWRASTVNQPDFTPFIAWLFVKQAMMQSDRQQWSKKNPGRMPQAGDLPELPPSLQTYASAQHWVSSLSHCTAHAINPFHKIANG
jgi:hypothetical protein